MNAAGIEGGYYVYRVNPRQVQAGHPRFLAPLRISYFLDEQRLVVEQRPFFAAAVPVRHAHARRVRMGGFWDSVWAVFVDAVCIGLILWIASGIYHVVGTSLDARMGVDRARWRRHLLRGDYRDALMFAGLRALNGIQLPCRRLTQSGPYRASAGRSRPARLMPCHCRARGIETAGTPATPLRSPLLRSTASAGFRRPASPHTLARHSAACVRCSRRPPDGHESSRGTAAGDPGFPAPSTSRRRCRTALR